MKNKPVARILAPSPRITPMAALLFTTAVALPIGMILWVIEALL